MKAKPSYVYFALLLLGCCSLQAQTADTEMLKTILQRMDTLEQENRQMAQELHELREQLAAVNGTAKAPLDERVAVVENRVTEQAQTKVEAAQKFPVTFSGQLLFNAFANTGNLQALPDSTYSPLLATTSSAGATLRQTILGFDFRGPSLPGDGKVNGSIRLDFFSGIPSEQYDWIRMRTSDISLDWAKRSITFAYDKPLISPREPNSLAEVGVPPLADAGNLWLWVPQVRYEERFSMGANAGITAQAAALETNEGYEYVPATLAGTLEKSRPAVEGRVGFWKSWNNERRVEVAGGFHTSTSHVAGASAASRIYSVDWLAAPFTKLQLSGTYFRGQNFASLGALPSGFSVTSNGAVVPVRGQGGWTQISSPLTSRLTLNLFGGLQDDRASDIGTGDVMQNLTYAGNLMYHVRSNVIFSLEALQMRTRLKADGDLIRNRYDLALAYLF